MKLYRLFCGPQAVDPGSVASLGSNMQTYLRDRGTSAGQVRTTTSASPESNIVCLYRGKVTD